MIEVGPSRTYTLAEFCTVQSDRIQKLDTKLLEFRNLLRDIVFTACRNTFSEAGFSAEEYSQELEELKRNTRLETVLYCRAKIGKWTTPKVRLKWTALNGNKNTTNSQCLKLCDINDFFMILLGTSTMRVINKRTWCTIAAQFGKFYQMSAF